MVSKRHTEHAARLPDQTFKRAKLQKAASRPSKAGPSSFRTYQLEAGQCLLMTGWARLGVESGSIWVQGKLLRAGQTAAQMSADGRTGGALSIECMATNRQAGTLGT
ncbi:hypothetical protein WJX74_007836 [Apatococcus lobatus]|uniref:Uncharacterized protein n=1 Tax=Apatococcus lobatus TaxID=904363 RepID=A0AAW1RZA2_9CHLO